MKETLLTTSSSARRLLWISLLLIIGTVFTISREGGYDFAQDYAAAWAWWHAMNPSAPTATIYAACCPQYYITAAYQTAHPPFATLLVLPFGLLPFTLVRSLWMILSTVMIIAAWEIAKVPDQLRLATACMWIFGLSLGALEPLVFLLLAVAVASQQERPQRAAIFVGLAAGIKIYPLVLTGIFLLSRRWRHFLVSIATFVFVTLLGHVVLGGNALGAWLAYTPINLARYLDGIGNPSLVRMLHMLLPNTSATILSAVILGILTLLMLAKLRAYGRIEQLIPVMLLSSPLVGMHYIACVSLSRIGRWAMILLGVGGLLMLAIRLILIPTSVAGIVALITLAGILLAYVDVWRGTYERENTI